MHETETNRVMFSFKNEEDKIINYTINRAQPRSEFPFAIASSLGRFFVNYQVFDPKFIGGKLVSLERGRHVNTVTREFDLSEEE